MRPIDADRLKEHIAAAVLDGDQEHKDRASALFRAIDSMPTVYDASKAIELLEVNSEYVQGSVEPYVRLDTALEIVGSD